MLKEVKEKLISGIKIHAENNDVKICTWYNITLFNEKTG